MNNSFLNCLNSDKIDETTKRMRNKILIVVLSVTMVILIVGLGLGFLINYFVNKSATSITTTTTTTTLSATNTNSSTTTTSTFTTTITLAECKCFNWILRGFFYFDHFVDWDQVLTKKFFISLDHQWAFYSTAVPVIL